ncbi:MAG: KamA family radical SAM protein [Bacteriovoracaceae bacterium]
MVQTNFSTLLTDHVRRQIEQYGMESEVGKQYLPDEKEMDLDLQEHGLIDPITDKEFNKAPQIIHRYKSRALFLPTHICPVHCRYCFRRNHLGQYDQKKTDSLFQQELSKTLDYLKSHPEILELIWTGGDPLSLSNSKIEKYLEAFSKIDHLKFMRIHSKFPTVQPSRIDEDLLKVFKNYKDHFSAITIVIHINHAKEISDGLKKSVEKLKNVGINVLSQSVLLKGVNDSQKALSQLFLRLGEIGVIPYYLHHPDRVKHAMHFYLPLEQGRILYNKLKNELPGWLIPRYVLDLPNGDGKTQAFDPEKFEVGSHFLNRNSQLTSVVEQ